MTDDCMRRCAPTRTAMADVPAGVVFVFAESGAGMQPCPECGHAGAWVGATLRCIVCERAHVPDRTFWQRYDRAPRVQRIAMARHVDAFERVLLGAKPRRYGWVL